MNKISKIITGLLTTAIITYSAHNIGSVQGYTKGYDAGKTMCEHNHPKQILRIQQNKNNTIEGIVVEINTDTKTDQLTIWHTMKLSDVLSQLGRDQLGMVLYGGKNNKLSQYNIQYHGIGIEVYKE